MWIARDKNGELYVYNDKPVLSDNKEFYITQERDFFRIPSEEFLEVTFENSPTEITSLTQVKTKK